jgi:pyruvate, water dikinase
MKINFPNFLTPNDFRYILRVPSRKKNGNAYLPGYDRSRWIAYGGFLLLLVQGCGSGDKDKKDSSAESDASKPITWECQASDESSVDHLKLIGCREDFDRLAAEPLDSSLPGASSVKTVIDQFSQDAAYFQNSVTYQIHWNFAEKHLSGKGLPIVGTLTEFNDTEYYSMDRRFLLGAVKYFRGPNVWVYEIAPYDTSTAAMIEKAYRIIRDSGFWGKELYFHPTSETVSDETENLPSSIPVISTEKLLAGTDYQPYHLGVAMGRLRLITAEKVIVDEVKSEDILVLDKIPNTLPAVSGIITEEPQSLLSEINYFSQSVRIPNIALRNARSNKELISLDGKWVRFEASAFGYSIDEVTQAAVEAWQSENSPKPVNVVAPNESEGGLTDANDIIDPSAQLADALTAGTSAYGAKASHFAALYQIKELVMGNAFVIPVSYYLYFLRQNGLDKKIKEIVADPSVKTTPSIRAGRLNELRAAIRSASIDAYLEKGLLEKLKSQYDYPTSPVTFRPSTNLDTLLPSPLSYQSRTSEVNSADTWAIDAVRSLWASLWDFENYEIRRSRGIDHESAAMAILVQPGNNNQKSNGIAFTANPYNVSGLEPAFYLHAESGNTSVAVSSLAPSTDRFIYFYYMRNYPTAFLQRSNSVATGQSILSRTQSYQLGKQLSAIHSYFGKIYGQLGTSARTWYAMEVTFTFNESTDEQTGPTITQALPSALRP